MRFIRGRIAAARHRVAFVGEFRLLYATVENSFAQLRRRSGHIQITRFGGAAYCGQRSHRRVVRSDRSYEIRTTQRTMEVSDRDYYSYVALVSHKARFSVFPRYNKSENLAVGSSEMMSFSHLLIEGRNKYSPTVKPYLDTTHRIVEIIEGFSHLSFSYRSLWPITIKTKPLILILKKNDRNSRKSEKEKTR